MLEFGDVAFGVGHEAEDQACGVADGGDVVDRAVGISGEAVGRSGVGGGVGERDLSVVPEGLTDDVVGGDELAFAVSDGEIDGFVEVGGPDASAGLRLEAHPLGGEAVGVVVGKRAGLSRAAGDGAGEQAGFDQDLESVADTNGGFSFFDKSAQDVAEVVDELVGEDFSGGDVVAVAEPAGDGEQLEFVEEIWVFEKAIEVDAFGFCAGKIEGVCGFEITIGAGGAKDEGMGGHGTHMIGAVQAWRDELQVLTGREREREGRAGR